MADEDGVCGWIGPVDRMPEAEVAIRLAEYMSEQGGFGGQVVFLPFSRPAADERELQRNIRAALDDGSSGWTSCL